MPQVRFEGLMQSLLRLPQVIRSIPDVIANPASNPLQAAILLAIAFVLVLIVLFSVLLVVVRPSIEDEELYGEAVAGAAGSAATQAAPLSWLTVISVIVLVIALLWVVTGVTTTGSEVCTSCHVDTVHSVATKASDPHSGVSCASCHETGGVVARATVNLPLRVQHFVLGRISASKAQGYGMPVPSDGCVQCHGSQIKGVVVNTSDGVRMSHKEPLEAGAQCVDCHVLVSGAVGPTTLGMAPCLRCHDGTVGSAECKTCHVGDPSDAIVSKNTTESMAAVQVPNPQCGSCHFDMTTCNACHGLGMPHSLDFMFYGHARPGAIAIWDKGGKPCNKCHYPGHNGCQRQGCHLGPFPSHPLTWKTLHSLTSWPLPNATICVCHRWNPYDHNGVLFCQLCHPVKPPRARP